MSDDWRMTAGVGWEPVGWEPVGWSLLAGLSTCLGASVAFGMKPDESGKSSHAFDDALCFSLALAGSVMVTVSVASLLPASIATTSGSIEPLWNARWLWERLGSFVGGALVSLTLSRLIGEPDVESFVENTMLNERPSSRHHYGQLDSDASNAAVANDPSSRERLERQSRAWRMTVLLLVSLALHNFPEGFAVAASSLHSTRLGVSTTLAIACHNMPEGIAIAVPCMMARPKDPWLAFGLASLSGLAEPLGAVMAVTYFQTGLVADRVANVLAFVAGIMVTVAVAELFPEALRCARSTERSIWTIKPLISAAALGALLMVGTERLLQ